MSMWISPCCIGLLCPSLSARSAIPVSKSTTRGSSGCWRFSCTAAIPSVVGVPNRFTPSSTFQLSAKAYGLNQLRYDLRKLKGHGLLQREGRRYAYRLTAKGVQVSLLFLFFHKRLCGPLANSRFHHKPDPEHLPNSKLAAAYQLADHAIQKIVSRRDTPRRDP